MKALKENEYIIITNRVKVSAALTILRDVLSGDDYGITDKQLSEITTNLRTTEEKLFSLIELNG